MLRTIMSEADIARGLQIVRENVKASFLRRKQSAAQVEPRLVAVSKTKPKELIIAAYKHGQRYFGENYVQELVEKSHDAEIQEKCPEIRWHLIGHLQRNKVNKVATVPNIYLVETIDSEKLASALDQAYLKVLGSSNERLRVMVQVNTSGEEEKSGCAPSEAPNLVKFIKEHCSALNVVGLMTIGQYGYDDSKGLNPDFVSLVECRKEVATALGQDETSLELSMGMSTDYEQAIEIGSTNVRVGTSIFGYREQKSKTTKDGLSV